MRLRISDLLHRCRGYICRCYRKKLHNDWESVGHGLDIFQEFADLYGDSINNIDTAERFFNDFMRETEGLVIVDFLDSYNWDCIRKIEVNKNDGLIWFYWQIPSGDPIEEMMKGMVFPFDYYGMCLKFDNVRFVKGRRKRCIGIIVNGYTIREKNIKGFAKNGGWNVKWIDFNSSFFATNVVREKDGVSQNWRFINTPISSFWIIPKQLDVHSQDSEKLLYFRGAEKCEKSLLSATDRIKGLGKLTNEDQRKEIKASAHDMRTVAESLFKLIMCFYQEEHHYKLSNYDDLTLGDLTGPLKKTVYKLEFEREMMDEIPRLANDLSHDSGNPVNFSDLKKLFIDISYFISDFKSKVNGKGNGIVVIHSDRPAPHDFVEAEYKNFCFNDEIKDIVHTNDGKISYVVKAQIGTFVDFLKEDEVLCKDGFLRAYNETGIEVLKVWDREEVIDILDKLYKKVIEECEVKGYDTETYSLGMSFRAVLRKEGKPSHLFTEQEIEELMRNADDGKCNRLVIDEEGYAHIIQTPQIGFLYPVSLETWQAGNMYVGKDSSLSDLHDSYVLCMHLWLDYLESGRHMYSDLYVSDVGLDKIIEDVKKYY